MALGLDSSNILDYPTNVVNVKCSRGEEQLGKLAVGHGRLYLSGSIILDGIDNGPRSMINAMSVDGCSGCPLFVHDDDVSARPDQTQAMLFSFLHGHTKHRHSRVAVEEASSNNHLFADKIYYGSKELQLQEVVTDEEALEALRIAEEQGEEPLNAAELAQPHALTSSDCPKIIQHIADKLQLPFSLTTQYSVNKIMNLLAKKVFLPDEHQQPMLILWDESSMMKCVFVPGTPTMKVQDEFVVI